jgi:type IV fimbrial biogenesis protein FimT
VLETIHRYLYQRKTDFGFTLLELMLTVAVIAILATIAIPVVRTPLEKQRLVAAAETLVGDLRWARSESIRRNKQVRVIFAVGANWSYCITLAQSCENSHTLLKTLNGDQFASTTLSVDFNNAWTTFDPVRGINLSDGKAIITTEHFSVSVIVGPLGHARICEFPQGGYRDPC